jgi:hypothetical protein
MHQVTYLYVIDYLYSCRDIIFPDDDGGPLWHQESHRSDVFKVFAMSYHSCPLHGEWIHRPLEARWVLRKNGLSKKG